MPLNEKLKQDLYQVVYDKLTGIPLPEGDFSEVIGREIDRAANWVEQRIKTSLAPARATDMPKSAEEAYSDRVRFNDYISANFLNYPRWDDLTTGQKSLYGNNQSFYRDGTLPWNLLTEEQRITFSSFVQFSPIKIRDAERLDGKATAYITTYFAPIIEVHYLALSFVSPPGYSGKNLFFRLYQKNEFYVYNKEGAIHIFPAVMARIANTTQDPLYGTQFGVVAPRIPQVIKIDYEYGYTDATRPLGLVEAVGLKAASQLLHIISAYLTGGLQGFGVDGFNASFSNGLLYKPLVEKYEQELKELLRPFYRPVMTAW